MPRLIYYSIRRTFQGNRAVLLFLMAGLFFSFFSMSVILGYAAQEYSYQKRLNAASSVSIWKESGLDKKTVDGLMSGGIAEKASNILLVAEEGNIRVVGWKGFGITQWFPHTTGRFFTEREEETGEYVAYVSDEYYKEGEEIIELNGKEYRITGAGNVYPYNIYAPIPKDSAQTIFPEDSEESLRIVVIPYTAFLREYSASLMLVHYEGMSRKKLEQIAERISDMFTGAEVLLPRWDTDKYYEEKTVSRGKIGLLFILICGVTILQFLFAWLRGNLYQYAVFYRMGMEKNKIRRLFVCEWFVCILISGQAAYGFHYLCRPFFGLLGAGVLPSVGYYSAVVATLFTVGILLGGFRLNRMELIRRDMDD